MRNVTQSKIVHAV